MTTTSQWRLRARRVIRAVLDALPADATEATRRKAVRDAYPFGERKMHPYRCWLQEVKATFTTGPVALPLPTMWLKFWHGTRAWWLTVRCEWCIGRVDGGCLQCLPLHQRVTDLTTSPEWKAWVEAVRQDFEAKGPWSDWLEERGHDDVAGLVRRTEQVPCPTCKGEGKTRIASPNGWHVRWKISFLPCQACDETGLVLQTQGGEPC